MTNQHHHHRRFKRIKNSFLILLLLCLGACWSSKDSENHIVQTSGIDWHKSNDDMIKECLRLKKTHPDKPLIYYQLAKAYFEENKIDSAAYNIEKVFEIDKNLIIAHELAAEIYLEKEDFEKVNFHSLITVSKGFAPPTLLYIKSRLSLNLGNTETALLYIDRALKGDHNTPFFVQKSRVLLSKKDTTSAKIILHKIMQRDSTDLEVLTLLFDIANAQNKPDASFHYAKRLLRLDSTNVKNKKRLTEVSQKYNRQQNTLTTPQ